METFLSLLSVLALLIIIIVPKLPRPRPRYRGSQSKRPSPPKIVEFEPRIRKAPQSRLSTQPSAVHLYDDEKAPPPVAPLPAGTKITGTAYVIDGDTIVLKKHKIRLAGIDAPELHQPWGKKSKWAMVAICKGHEITATTTGETSYDRQVGVCVRADGVDIGAELITQGLALDFGHFSDGKYRHLEPHGIRKKLNWSKTVNNG
ncbi:thermonuclease family protein [Falsihalocynthiibacter sp. SS001]|uniref:thermonuclease family protein n=1 Tax=Falsihalocynthiibacter sp. SS001 TaxID=3349698 RepID=UPI0036D3AFE3